MPNYEILTDSETDSDSDGEMESDSLSSDGYWFDELEYETEEPSTTKNNIVICQRYNSAYMGVSTPAMNYHYLVHIRLKKFNYNIIHNIYRNYLDRDVKCLLEIAECHYLQSGHCIAILKTFWIRIIQRAWKRAYKLRKTYFASLVYNRSREIFGKWPARLPGLRGLLCSSSALG